MKFCFSCMSELSNDTAICPACGAYHDETMEEAYSMLPGSMIAGRYYIGKVLSKTKYEITYRAYDCYQKRRVFFKELFPIDVVTRLYGDTSLLFFSENNKQLYADAIVEYLIEGKRLLNLFSCEQITEVYDAFPDNNHAYMVTEYLEGITLEEMLHRNKTLSIEQANLYITQLLEGLKVIHNTGVIHGNLCPSNVWITSDDRVKIMGLGNAQYAYSLKSKYVNGLFATGYAPYERYRNADEQGPWTDIYSVAAIYYKMITGVTPPDATDRKLKDHLRFPSRMGMKLEPEIENLLEKSLCVEAKNRIQDTDTLLAVLQTQEDSEAAVGKRKKIMFTILFAMLCVGSILSGAALAVRKVKDSGKDAGQKAESSITTTEQPRTVGEQKKSTAASAASGAGFSDEDGEEEKEVLTYSQIELESVKDIKEHDSHKIYSYEGFRYSYKWEKKEIESFEKEGEVLKWKNQLGKDFEEGQLYEATDKGVYIHQVEAHEPSKRIGTINEKGIAKIPVTLVTSLGYRTVPDNLIGRSKRSVVSELKELDYKVEVIEEYHSYDPGIIYQTSPDENSKCTSGIIKLYVSKGSKTQPEVSPSNNNTSSYPNTTAQTNTTARINTTSGSTSQHNESVPNGLVGDTEGSSVGE